MKRDGVCYRFVLIKSTSQPQYVRKCVRQVLCVLTKLRGILGTHEKFLRPIAVGTERRCSDETGDSSFRVVCIFFMSRSLAQLPRFRVSYSRAVAYPRGI